MTSLNKQTEMDFSLVNDAEVPVKPHIPVGHQSCNNPNTASFYMFTTDNSTSVVAEASLDTKAKTANVILKNWNGVLVGQVEQIRPMEAEADSTAQCFSGPPVSEQESCHGQQKTSKSSGEILLDVEPSLPIIRKQGFLNGPRCEEILKNLELLQDSGKFQEHKQSFNFFLERAVKKRNKDVEVNKQQIPNRDNCHQALKKIQHFQENGRLKKDEQLLSLYSRLCTKKEYADMELALIIEQGVSFMYHKQLSKSKLYFASVIELAGHCKVRNPNILIARAYVLLAANCNSRARKTKNVPVIMEYLNRSEVLLQNHESPEDLAEMYFTLGIVYLGRMSRIPDDERNSKARTEIRERARTFYERAIAICKKDPRPRVQLKRLTYCHLGLSALLLDCSSTAARNRIKVIPSQDINDATKHLDIIEQQLGDIPPGTRVQILKKRSDQCYRQGPEMYQLARETAQDALQMAHSHGFNTELESLQQRIDFLDQLCEDTACRERIKLLVDVDSSKSGSDSRYEASCSESDEKQSKNG